MKKSSQTKALSAASLDEMHDSGKDLSAHLIWQTLRVLVAKFNE